jgi:hypothetical protein
MPSPDLSISPPEALRCCFSIACSSTDRNGPGRFDRRSLYRRLGHGRLRRLAIWSNRVKIGVAAVEKKIQRRATLGYYPAIVKLVIGP